MPVIENPPASAVFTKVDEDALAHDLLRAVNKAIEKALDSRPMIDSNTRNRAETAAKAACAPIMRRVAFDCSGVVNGVLEKADIH